MKPCLALVLPGLLYVSSFAQPGPGEKPRKVRAAAKVAASAGPPRRPAPRHLAGSPRGEVVGDPAKGKQLFKGKCAICHFDTSTAERVGPGMKGLFKLEKMPKSGLAPTEENVRKLILDGSGTMQPFRDVLTRQQLADLIAYLKTL